MICHGHAPRAAHWPLMMYGVTTVMFGERRPQTSIEHRQTVSNTLSSELHVLSEAQESYT